jgi:NTE family protein
MTTSETTRVPHKASEARKGLVLAGGGARGAFQVGVLAYLAEIGWQPSVISGSSVGAINAVALGIGMSPQEMARLWQSFTQRAVYRIRPARILRYLFGRHAYYPPLDTKPLKTLLSTYVDFKKLRQSPLNIFISAVNMGTAQLHYFDNSTITLDYLMASSAMPLLFPWIPVDGQDYWDGGLMANTPIVPVINAECTEIIVVLLSPIGQFDQSPPRTALKTLEMVIEHLLIGSYQTHLNYQRSSLKPHPYGSGNQQPGPSTGTRIHVVAPPAMLGLRSLIHFNRRDARRLVRLGYEQARRQLKGLENRF